MPRSATRFDVFCKSNGCQYLTTVGSQKEADRAATAHMAASGGHDVATLEQIPLPGSPVVGDRIRVRPERQKKLQAACEAAGYDFDPDAIVTVQREEARPGGRSLWFARAPFSYYAGDVMLAWNNEQERREGLRKAGHRV